MAVAHKLLCVRQGEKGGALYEFERSERRIPRARPADRVDKCFYMLIAFSFFVKENATKNRRQLNQLARFFNKVFYKNAKPFGSHFFGQLLYFFARQ